METAGISISTQEVLDFWKKTQSIAHTSEKKKKKEKKKIEVMIIMGNLNGGGGRGSKVELVGHPNLP